MPSCLQTCGTFKPLPSPTSAWRSLPTICSGRCRFFMTNPFCLQAVRILSWPLDQLTRRGSICFDLRQSGWARSCDTRNASRRGVHGIPETMLIGPDGILIARHLSNEAIKQGVTKAMGER